MKMRNKIAGIVCLLLAAAAPAATRLAAQTPTLKVDKDNRTLTVTATETVTVDPELAVLHVGFQTGATSDAKSAYSAGSVTSNAIYKALVDAGVPKTSIRSESQFLGRDWDPKGKPKYSLSQQWTVKVPIKDAAIVLDAAVGAGANDSGQIDWIVADDAALDAQALSHAAEKEHATAEELAKGMGVKLGSLLYVSNRTESEGIRPMMANNAIAYDRAALQAAPLAITPRKIARTATVYAVFAIE